MSFAARFAVFFMHNTMISGAKSAVLAHSSKIEIFLKTAPEFEKQCSEFKFLKKYY